MSKMLPSIYDPSTKSTAEKRIFTWFDKGYGTEDWIVLHSLGINNHVKQIHGEIDFVVLAPGLGLYVLEVKGGDVNCIDGIWSFTNKEGETTKKARGPFEQAWEGAHSLINIIKSRLDDEHRYLQYLLYGIGVMFPDTAFDANKINEDQWKVFDLRTKSIYDYITELARNTKSRYVSKFSRWDDRKLLSKEDCEYIAELLRPDFECVVPLNIKIESTEEQIISLTQEEYSVLDLIEANSACVIYGPAGTGKTLLAVEECRRSLLRNEKIAFFCFNKNLADWLSRHVKKHFPKGPEFIGTFHKYLAKVLIQNGFALPESLNDNETEEFYTKIIPNTVLAIVSGQEPVFDRIIIDEAQDLLLEPYLEIMNCILKGRLKSGKWTLFGDFHLQNIYLDSGRITDSFKILENEAAFTKVPLTRNCRNTESICNAITTVVDSKILENYKGRIKGEPVVHRLYTSEAEEKEKLIVLLEKLSSENINNSSITILSPYSFSNSIASKIPGYRILPIHNLPKDDAIMFSTIQGYKGLENEIIIITDINSYDNKELAYVGMSRARSGLFLFESQKANDQFIKKMMRNNAYVRK